jgi:MFS family permease
VRLAPGQIRAQATASYYLVISVIAQLIGPPVVGLITDGMGDPAALRYAVSIEAAAVGIPSIVLVLLGFAAYRRSVAELDAKIEKLSLTPALAGVGVAR